MKKLLLIIITILVTSCAPQKQLLQPTITQNHDLSSFKSLIVSGNTNIELINGPYAINVFGTPKDLQGYQEQLLDKTLSISANYNVTIQLSVPELKNITVINNATINAQNFKTNHLTIIAKNNGAIDLKGRINIDKIYQHSNGRITVDWVSSDQLLVESDSNGPIYLAGRANNLTAKLTNNTQLDARYLRTKEATIFTTDKARADVLVLDTLKAFAVNKSNICYYKRPKHLTVVTKNAGNVLHPDWIH